MMNISQIDARLFTSASTLRQISNRCSFPTTLNAGFTSHNGWTWHSFPAPISKIKVGVANSYAASGSAEAGPGATSTWSVGIEYPAFSGNWYQLIAGLVVASNAVGDTGLVALPFTIPAFTPVRISLYAACASGVCYNSWSQSKDAARGDAWDHTATDKTLGGTITNADAVTILKPVYVLGVHNRRVWAGVGDSIMAGVGDSFPDPCGALGAIGRAVVKFGCIFHNLGTPGETAQNFAANSANRQAILGAGGATHGVINLGVNDFTNSRTAANVQADRTTIKGLLPSIKFFDASVTMVTTSTDTFATTSNQTIASGTKDTQRKAFNNAMRGPGVTYQTNGLIDICDVAETDVTGVAPVRDGSFWLARSTPDGTHPASVLDRAIESLVLGTLATVGGA